MAVRQLWKALEARLLVVGRFTYLLAALGLLLLLYPLLEGEYFSQVVLRILFSVLLLAALHATSGRRWTVGAAVFLFAPAFLVHWATVLVPKRELPFVDSFLAVAILSLTAGTIIASVLHAKHVTLETIGGALCAYLLLGLIWAFLFGVIELAQPGSIRFALEEPHHEIRVIFGEKGFSQFLYFSYSTLTTLGYGDILPRTTLARTIACAEAVFGQIYMAVLVARLVGLHIAQASRENSSSK
jgi:hypothetical protein